MRWWGGRDRTSHELLGAGSLPLKLAEDPEPSRHVSDSIAIGTTGSPTQVLLALPKTTQQSACAGEATDVRLDVRRSKGAGWQRFVEGASALELRHLNLPRPGFYALPIAGFKDRVKKLLRLVTVPAWSRSELMASTMTTCLHGRSQCMAPPTFRGLQRCAAGSSRSVRLVLSASIICIFAARHEPCWVLLFIAHSNAAHASQRPGTCQGADPVS